MAGSSTPRTGAIHRPRNHANVSVHTPPRGGRRPGAHQLRSRQSFQSTPPRGGDLYPLAPCSGQHPFQSGSRPRTVPTSHGGRGILKWAMFSSGRRCLRSLACRMNWAMFRCGGGGRSRRLVGPSPAPGPVVTGPHQEQGAFSTGRPRVRSPKHLKRRRAGGGKRGAPAGANLDWGDVLSRGVRAGRNRRRRDALPQDRVAALFEVGGQGVVGPDAWLSPSPTPARATDPTKSRERFPRAVHGRGPPTHLKRRWAGGGKRGAPPSHTLIGAMFAKRSEPPCTRQALVASRREAVPTRSRPPRRRGRRSRRRGSRTPRALRACAGPRRAPPGRSGPPAGTGTG